MKYYSIVFNYKGYEALEKTFACGCALEQVQEKCNELNNKAGYNKYYIVEQSTNPIGWME